MTQIAERVTVEVGGAQVAIPAQFVVKAWLESLATTASTPVPATGRPTLAAGELYAGVILGKDGAPDHHLILLPGAAEEVTWEKAKEWAASIGGELPTRREQSLLYANLKEEFEEAWYWSGVQSARYSDYAWGQTFNAGGQDGNRKRNAFRARAVRRLIL
ncbi:conserved hypothetical protein [Cupriavidus necator]|uniref:DUF1566 domain-containing protein n=1 Tax=Cupriavidus necator TaxID=106590 RepID=A0A1K0JC86_CUPNE|nr:conserved hypothetical protein [Cupriavidus necator]